MLRNRQYVSLSISSSKCLRSYLLFCNALVLGDNHCVPCPGNDSKWMNRERKKKIHIWWKFQCFYGNRLWRQAFYLCDVIKSSQSQCQSTLSPDLAVFFFLRNLRDDVTMLVVRVRLISCLSFAFSWRQINYVCYDRSYLVM